MTIPSEYKTKCSICGEILDIRDLQVNLCHSVYDEEVGEYICLSQKEIENIKNRLTLLNSNLNKNKLPEKIH